MLSENYVMFDVKGTRYRVPTELAVDIQKRARRQRPIGKYRPPRATTVKPAANMHSATTLLYIKACRSLGLEFWSLSHIGGCVWAVDGHTYTLVRVNTDGHAYVVSAS